MKLDATMLGHAVHRGKDATHKTLLCNAHARPLQCWKSCANGSNIVAHHFSNQLTEQKKCWELLAQKFDCSFKLNFAQQLPATCNNMPITCNIQQCWELLTNGVEFVCTGFTQKNKVLSVTRLLPGPVFINLSLRH